jgi:hypothetical protein
MIVPFVRVSNAVTRSNSRRGLQPLKISIPAGTTQMEQHFFRVSWANTVRLVVDALRPDAL